MTHPSFLALDRHALGVHDASIAAHLQECEACRFHIDYVQAPTPLLLRRPPQRSWWPALAGGVVAIAACIALFLVREDDIRSKGGVPTVGVYVKRGEDVFLWNGVAPLRADDRIRLRIRSAEYKYLRVEDGERQKLFEGPLSAAETTLPLSWQIEPGSTTEKLRVILSQSASHPYDYRVELVLPITSEESP